MQLDILESVLILLVIAVLVTTLCRRFHISAIVGYILVGMAVGPHMLAWITTTENTRNLAEFGIVFLLFTIGLEFSLSRLIAMRKIVFVYGGLQVLIGMAIVCLIGMLFNMTLPEVIIIGSVVAMSSTAIVIKQLRDQLELHAKQGMNALGLLLFQDIAVVPLLILIPNLVAIDTYSLSVHLFLALIKGALAIITIIFIGRWVMRPLFYQIGKRQSLELFTLTVLLVTLGAAWLTQQLELTLALGAFLAGIMLGETEFRHQIDDAIIPFRDVLLALFFISIGMQLDPGIIIYAWYWVLLLLSVLIFFKCVLISGLGLLLGHSKVISVRTGIILAQGGEFGFVILLLAMNYELLSRNYTQVILGALLISMLIAPLFVQFNHAIANFILFRKPNKRHDEVAQEVATTTRGLRGHVIICGYGHVGQNIARLLEKSKIPFIAFDLDAARVAEARLAGDDVFYADASRYPILQAAKLNKAKGVIVSFYNTSSALKILQYIRRQNKHVATIMRSYNDSETELFYNHGATEVIPEPLEISLLLTSHILLLMGVSIPKVRNIIDEVRLEQYDLLYPVFSESAIAELEAQESLHHVLHVVILTDTAFAVNKKIKELCLEKYDVTITRIRRGSDCFAQPKQNIRLQADDNIVLYGVIDSIQKAKRILLDGRISES